MALPIDTLLRDDELTLRWLPGSTPRMVVVFTGLKARVGGQPLDEFARSASMSGQNNVLFVTDERASWYSARGLWARIVRSVRTIRNAEGIREVVSLGTSMGGFGALLLPRDLRVTRAIAFAPQVTMDRAVLDDIRWPDVAKRWGSLVERDLPATMGTTRTQYYVSAGGNCPEDLGHLNLLPEHKRVHRFVLPRGRHNLARSLKDAGVLSDVIAAILRGNKARVERLYEKYAEVMA
ncbi:hypothetical protein JANAI62_19400 [Jannaschia pagri]|uniref:Peptidase S9 prolyl oligopeptidase catalytic domain-containing protein n=1 Tax=Jannaschia pagri TaxID=2829797 RepID=A0ABQ4NLM9_9RHOB|nr:MULTISPECIES: hypothetical protein [unclassified Jannaschia]GIT91483.1 hypothetical protein JANAI61_19410 [Jannaschia sp. AI_61]GIT95317.1 hypothetical protein JANAI62_19400 [Jannaschia sp. AI_62]